ncbi:hypothetical protein EXM22_05155 [Oceanispirochaeta crateris]|uniref:GAF domain-containing protein n=2 Tax=Oceanispirochaeta crateris TaxID=2518645 RepID=A0A5C1QIX0_9SPIO|nr:hypothetical protein EXM22_05155 [Oceanispirochaeta crateris]
MGLLNRAANSQIEEESVWSQFFNKVESIGSSVDFAAILFRYLTESFNIDKASLFLINDDHSSYDCLLSKGYDITTTNRLRLDNHVMDSKEFSLLLQNKSPLCTTEVPLFLKNYMSSREFGLLEDIYWLPFVVNDHLYSVIMITQWASFVPDDWEDSFQIISSRYSSKIFNSRKVLLENPVHSQRKPLKDDIAMILAAYEGRDIAIIKINLQPLMNLLSQTDDGLSHIHIKKEILSVFRTMAGSQQKILELDNNQILLFLDKLRISDKELFLHQLAASLPLIFQDLKSTPKLDFVEYKNPSNAEGRSELLREIL